MDALGFAPGPLPATLPTPAAWLLGWVDTSVPGHRQIRYGATTVTVPSGYYRGDALAAQLTALGLPTALGPGVFTVTPPSPATLRSIDQLGVIMGLFALTNETRSSAATHTSNRISPVAIPLQGAHWTQLQVDSDDVLTMSRAARAAGYVWGAVRVWEVELYLARHAFEALQRGWCLRGKVTVTPALSGVSPMSAGETQGLIEGQVLQVMRPEWTSPTEVQARVRMRIAEVPA
jgi:hypothetical protein